LRSTEHIPTISVGILSRPEVHFVLLNDFSTPAFSGFATGEYAARRGDGGIVLERNGTVCAAADEFTFRPAHAEGSFIVKDVAIGMHFHWERTEDQHFRGQLRLVRSDEGIALINDVNIEEYLSSVISSEMNASASRNFLKAHAVTSRSWLLAQLERPRILARSGTRTALPDEQASERVRWYDREEHALFDVCADDHCQRYHGITKVLSPSVREAVDETCGQVLVYGGTVCDARFSKCCGGVTEEFSAAWGEQSFPYLMSIADEPTGNPPRTLRTEAAAREWIQSSPPAFCNTSDKTILAQILPATDLETPDFFRWRVEYAQEELADIIGQRSGMDFGHIVDLVPVERGNSGRLIKLKIVGTRTTLTIGKELEIRRTLSRSHLYSSAFVIDRVGEKDALPSRFVLRGAGWGHGVGLCQIGAAVMGEMGFSSTDILRHYFPAAELKKLY
jgi:SpoIID/LytB domain protein